MPRLRTVSWPRPSLTEIAPLLIAAAIPVTAIVAAAGLLACLPLLLLVVPLLFGRYPGIEAIVRLAERRARRPARDRLRSAPAWGGIGLTPPRGGRLIATGLAKRPPPAAPFVA
jgi:hypothetical protein